MRRPIPEWLRYTWPHRLACAVRDRWQIAAWERRGRQGEAPHAVKRAALLDCARRHRAHVLVETGTFRGEMLFACRRRFEAIYSIEVDPLLAAAAQARFARWPHVRVLCGNSATSLPEVLSELTRRAIFWLDAHYCGPAAGRAGKDTPILEELRLILSHPVPDHVILVDDARCFGVLPDYPQLEECAGLVRDLRPNLRASLGDDILRFEPAQEAASQECVWQPVEKGPGAECGNLAETSVVG